MKNYKNNENNIEKIVNEISYLSERFENVKNIWYPEKMDDYFSSYYKRIKECFYELNQNRLHFEDNIGKYYGIFKNCLYTGATDYIDSFERASHYEGSYWNVVTDQEYMANVRAQERNLENSWENIKRRNRKEKIEYFYQNLLIIEGLLKKDTFKYLVNNNVYDCLLCYPLDKFEKYMDEIVIRLLITFACSYFITEDEIINEIIKHISKDEFFYDYFVMEFKKIKEDLFLENHAENLY